MFRRRREKKTDYRQRLALLKSKKTRMIIRRSLKGVRIQFTNSGPSGDVVVVERTSKNLSELGWSCHSANLPASYLTGFLAGAEALSKGVKDAIVDIGLQNSARSSGLYCAAAGARDAGVAVNIGEEAIPPKDRISGKHIADYAAKIKNSPAYQRQFSSYLKKGINPEKINEIFSHVKTEITAKYGIKER